jgi:hypothetical protein
VIGFLLGGANGWLWAGFGLRRGWSFWKTLAMSLTTLPIVVAIGILIRP